MRSVRLAFAFAIVAGVLTSGCGKGPAYGDVDGVVTLDGQPVKEGRLHFTPTDGKTPTAAALITDGKFRERVPVGTHKVEIYAPKYPPGYVPKVLKSGTVEEGAVTVGELIPDRYNAKSDLTLKVDSGLNKPKFELKSTAK